MADDDTTDDTTGELIVGRFDEPSLIRERPSTLRGCQHRQVGVREGKERGVWCVECEAELDPIAVLADFADKERRLYWSSQEAKKRTDRATKELEEVERKLRNAKARLRRMESKIAGSELFIEESGL